MAHFAIAELGRFDWAKNGSNLAYRSLGPALVTIRRGRYFLSLPWVTVDGCVRHFVQQIVFSTSYHFSFAHHPWLSLMNHADKFVVSPVDMELMASLSRSIFSNYAVDVKQIIALMGFLLPYYLDVIFFAPFGRSLCFP
jgi:hypothetical protein